MPARLRLVQLLGSAGGPRTAQDLAAELGVHPTAIRQHMSILIEAGLVGAEPFAPTGRGRPRVGYRLIGETNPMRWLATALATGMAKGWSARETGRQLGAARHRADVDPVTALMEEAQHVGFHPRSVRRAGTVEILLEQCPFADVLPMAADVVCDLHRGLAEGLVTQHPEVESVGLQPATAEGEECLMRVRLRTAG